MKGTEALGLLLMVQERVHFITVTLALCGRWFPGEPALVPSEGAAAQAAPAKPGEGARLLRVAKSPLFHGERRSSLWKASLGSPADPASHLPKVTSPSRAEGSSLLRVPREPHPCISTNVSPGATLGNSLPIGAQDSGRLANGARGTEGLWKNLDWRR